MTLCIPFNCLALDVGEKIHNFNTDTIKAYLTNVAPVLTNTVYNTPADLATAGGYTAGGLSTGTNVYTQSGGIATLAPGLSTVTFTATSGFGPFRYAVLYNFTAAAKNLIGYYDNTTPVTLTAGQSFDLILGAAIANLQFSSV